jgi:cation diffusion facilitator CzcD-associated flavoprotein CzcO
MKEILPIKLHILPLILGSFIVVGISLILGLIGHFFYWLLYDSFGRSYERSKRKLKWTNSQRDIEYYVIIIGTGFSGLGMAIKMNKLGMDNYILIERHGHVGGTWYANQYPGCACDVPSNLYSFSFEPNPKWSYYFSRQPEIREYLEYCTDKYNLRRHIYFNTTVTELKWLKDQQLWQVTTQWNDQKDIFYARSVVLGSGLLSTPSYPTDIAGIDKFQGEMCHTAEWNGRIEFKNKRVAVIGTGASAIQVIPEIQKMDVSELIVFQRTPPWVIPRIDRCLNDWEKNLLERFPIVQKLIRVMLYWGTESLALSFAYRWPIRFLNQILAKYNLKRQVKDKELRKKLTPTWDFGCKRILLTNDWYSTLQQSNVKLVTNRIREIKSHSLVTYDGDEYPVDIIIWSTGFEAQKFSIPVYGINGCSLIDQWSQTIQVSVFKRNIYFFDLSLIGISWCNCT